MIVIANPPYSDNNNTRGNNKHTFARQLCLLALKMADKVVWLMPSSAFGYDNLVPELTSYKALGKKESAELFEGASCPPLSIGYFDKSNPNQVSISEWSVATSHSQLLKAISEYHKVHDGLQANLYSYFSNPFSSNRAGEKGGNKFSVNAIDKYDEDFFTHSVAFGRYWIDNGIHADGGNAMDNFWNYKCKTKDEFKQKCIELNSKPDFLGFTFKENGWKDNYEDWKHNSKLYEKILREVIDAHGGTDCLWITLCDLDWSHPWTDEEILKELGLPEDFLNT